MKWFYFFGEDDEVLPVVDGFAEIQAVFKSTALPSEPQILYTTAEEYPDGVPGLGHADDCRFYRVMLEYILDGTVGDISDYSECEHFEGSPVSFETV